MYLEGEEKKSLKARSRRALCERSGLVSSSRVTPARCPRARRSAATSVQARCERGDGCAKEPPAGGSWWGEKRQGRQGGEIGRRDESPGLLGVGMLNGAEGGRRALPLYGSGAGLEMLFWVRSAFPGAHLLLSPLSPGSPRAALHLC